MRIQRNLRLIDAYTLCMNSLFVLPVILPYYRDEIGIGFREFLIGEAFFAATIILLDVPTGWISDMWKRKNTQALGFFFLFLGYATLFVAASFFWAVVAQVLVGVGIGLCNGTNTSILYESLLSVGREGEYRRREGRRQAMCLYTTGITSVIGGFLYSINHHLPLGLMLITLVGAFTATCMLDEPERHRRRPERHPIMDILATIKYALHGHKEIGFTIMFAASLFCSTKLLMWTQQPYYMEMKVPESWYGIFMAVGFMIGGLSSHLGHKLDGRVSARQALSGLFIAALIICIGTALSPVGWHGVVLLMLGGTSLYGMASPRVNEVINKHVDSARRATVLSTQGLLVSLLFIPLSTGIGWLSKHGGIQHALLGIGAWLCFAGIILIFLVLRGKSVLYVKR